MDSFKKYILEKTVKRRTEKISEIIETDYVAEIDTIASAFKTICSKMPEEQHPVAIAICFTKLLTAFDQHQEALDCLELSKQILEQYNKDNPSNFGKIL